MTESRCPIHNRTFDVQLLGLKAHVWAGGHCCEGGQFRKADGSVETEVERKQREGRWKGNSRKGNRRNMRRKG